MAANSVSDRYQDAMATSIYKHTKDIIELASLKYSMNNSISCCDASLIIPRQCACYISACKSYFKKFLEKQICQKRSNTLCVHILHV